MNARWIVWILISTDIFCRPFIPFVIRRDMVVAQSGGFRGDWRIRICFSPIKSVLLSLRSSVSGLRWLCWSRARLMASIAYSRTDQYVFITQWSHSCVLDLPANNTEYSFSTIVLWGTWGCQTSHRLRVSQRVFLQYIVSWGTRSVKHHSHQMLPLINLTYFSLLPHRLWMPIYML